jgi:uncharacterized RDD family membrane protein YckC
VIVVSWIVFITLTEFTRGQSLGKRIAKIRVVKADFGTTTIINTLIRHLFDIVDLTLLMGVVVIFTNTRKQRVGDVVAKTMVVSV